MIGTRKRAGVEDDRGVLDGEEVGCGEGAQDGRKGRGRRRHEEEEGVMLLSRRMSRWQRAQAR